MEFSIFQETRRGGRKVNQDRVGYIYTRDALFVVVADGMGGHVGGEIAAHITVRLLLERFEQEAKPVLASPVLFLQNALKAAHSALADYAQRFRLVDTPRTTCVACVVQDDAAYWRTPAIRVCTIFAGDPCRHELATTPRCNIA
jgi:serine/threonine protein phosphatase PrpC